MTTPNPSTPNYGSITTNGNKKKARPPIQLHASLESLDVGPHAFRSSSPLPQDADFVQLTRRSSSPHPQATLLRSPLLRKFSHMVVADDDGNTNDLPSPLSNNPSLNVPILDDTTGGAVAKNDASTEQKRESENTFHLFISLSMSSFLTVFLSFHCRFHLLRCLCTGELNYVYTMFVWLRLCHLQPRSLRTSYQCIEQTCNIELGGSSGLFQYLLVIAFFNWPR